MGELGAIDRHDLHDLGEKHRDAYRTASPWPHVVIDGLFDPAVVARARAEELGPALELIPRRSNRRVKAESPGPAGPTAGAILQRLLADDVCDMLTTLTGIPDLVSDPTHWWAGVHVLAPGSFEAVHRDFAHDATGHLWHRVNILVYLNPDWQSEWGGQLELWDTSMTTCHRRVEPVGGRVIIFEPGPDALHGIPGGELPRRRRPAHAGVLLLHGRPRSPRRATPLAGHRAAAPSRRASQGLDRHPLQPAAVDQGSGGGGGAPAGPLS